MLDVVVPEVERCGETLKQGSSVGRGEAALPARNGVLPGGALAPRQHPLGRRARHRGRRPRGQRARHGGWRACPGGRRTRLPVVHGAPALARSWLTAAAGTLAAGEPAEGSSSHQPGHQARGWAPRRQTPEPQTRQLCTCGSREGSYLTAPPLP